jgi:hypothetical protein
VGKIKDLIERREGECPLMKKMFQGRGSTFGVHSNFMSTISGFVSRRMGGPQVPAPLEV